MEGLGGAVGKAMTAKSPIAKRTMAAVKVNKTEARRMQQKQRGKMIYEKASMVKEEMAAASDPRELKLAQLTDSIFAHGGSFLSSAANVAYVPNGNPAVPEVALAGRSMVGKTALLRALFKNRNPVSIANSQKRQGLVQYFSVGNVFNIAETPGFAGTVVPWSVVLQHAVLIRNFVRYRPSLKMLYYCMDIHPTEGVCMRDVDVMKFLAQEAPNFTIVLTKSDRMVRDGTDRHFTPMDVREELIRNGVEHPVMSTSAFQMGGIDALRMDMVSNALHALPTARLTYSEARALGDRLLSQKELSTVRPLALPPTELDEELAEWRRQNASDALRLLPEARLGAPEDAANFLEVAVEEAAAPVPAAEESNLSSAVGEEDAATDRLVDEDMDENDDGVDNDDGDNVVSFLEDAGEEEVQKSLSLSPGAALPATHPASNAAIEALDAEERAAAYKAVVKKLENGGLMDFVNRTSPWRNPLKWPTNVIPTKHKRVNIMRLPQAPHNPYLSQALFVAPRADMHFRSPNIGVINNKKGRYLVGGNNEETLRLEQRSTTIPYFPDIVDARMRPAAWMFLGSRSKFYEQPGGKQLGIQLQQQALNSTINPLDDFPTKNPSLAHEVQKLEAKRYGKPIAFLRPAGGTKAPSLASAAEGARRQLEASNETSPETNPL